MARYRSGSIVGKVVAFIVSIALLAGVLALFWWLSDGVWGTLPTFTVTTGGHKYSVSKTDVKLYPGTDFEVNSFFGKKYTLKIEASADTADFALTVDGEEKKWSDYEGKDFSAGFTIGKSENKYTVNYTSLTDVCAAVLGQSVEIADDVQGDIFDVVIVCGKREVRLSCYVSIVSLPSGDEAEQGSENTDADEDLNKNQENSGEN